MRVSGHVMAKGKVHSKVNTDDKKLLSVLKPNSYCEEKKVSSENDEEDEEDEKESVPS